MLEPSTVTEGFEAAAGRHGDRPAQSYKGGVYDRSLVAAGVVAAPPASEFATITYDDLRGVVRRLAAGFRSLGVTPDDRVALFAETRMEWASADLAVLAAGGVVATVYPSSSTRQVERLLNDAGATGVVVENGGLLGQVAEAETPALEFAVSMDDLDEEGARVAEGMGEEVLTLGDLHERGAEDYDADAYDDWVDARGPEDLASIIYTSGTTGRPKGVKLTHGNFRANARACFRRFGPRPDRADEPVVDERATALSFLPLSHVFERLVGHFLLLHAGATVAYAESPETLREDLQTVRPTVLTSVPRVYEKLLDAVRESAGEGPRGRLLSWALNVGRAFVRTDDPGPTLRAKHALADRLVFRKVREAVGGNIEFLISGGGSLPPDLARTYHAMGLPVLEGYGLTETSPVVSVNPPEAPVPGTIGPPLHGVETRLDTSVGRDLSPLDGGEVGELLVRGPNVTEGYWERPEATAMAFETVEGASWFRTGDIVERRPDEYLRFRERAKELIALSTGKKAAPVPIEDALSGSEFVEQAMVLGDGRKYVAALVVPSVPRVRKWAEREGVDLPADPATVCADERVHERIGREVDRVNEAFEPHERVKAFDLVPEEFTEANDLLTPTLKKKRRNILDRYAEAVAALYEEGDRVETD